MNYKHLEDLFAAIGAGKVAPRMVGNRVQAILDSKPVEESAKKKREEAVVEAAKRTHGLPRPRDASPAPRQLRRERGGFKRG